ncbi:hypothetical protein FOZ63_006989, partial [Perkinsus olseni]
LPMLPFEGVYRSLTVTPRVPNRSVIAEAKYRPARSGDYWQGEPIPSNMTAFVAVDTTEKSEKAVIGIIKHRKTDMPTFTNFKFPPNSPEDGDYINIYWVKVDEKWRGKGVATEMLKRFLAYVRIKATSTHPVAAWLEVESTNEPAVRLYKSAHFELVARGAPFDFYRYIFPTTKKRHRIFIGRSTLV